MKKKNIRIALNAILVILILISKIIIRRKRKIIYFNANTGVSMYRTTYYILLLIPVFSIKKTIPNTGKKK